MAHMRMSHGAYVNKSYHTFLHGAGEKAPNLLYPYLAAVWETVVSKKKESDQNFLGMS